MIQECGKARRRPGLAAWSTTLPIEYAMPCTTMVTDIPLNAAINRTSFSLFSQLSWGKVFQASFLLHNRSGDFAFQPTSGPNNLAVTPARLNRLWFSTFAVLPNLDQTKSTGLVTLPGAFVGALFGGASPVEAAQFQLVVLAAIMLSMLVCGWVVTRLASESPYVTL